MLGLDDDYHQCFRWWPDLWSGIHLRFLLNFNFCRVHTGNDPAYSQRCGQTSVHVSVQSQSGSHSGLFSSWQPQLTFSKLPSWIIHGHSGNRFCWWHHSGSHAFVLVVWSRFHPRAAQLLLSMPASRSPPVNSPWRKSSSPHQQSSSGSLWTRRWVSGFRKVSFTKK